MSLRSHLSPIPNVEPSFSYVEKHIDKDDRDHWFWVPRKGKRTHCPVTGQAILKWTVPPSVQTLYVSHGRYNVARLLLERLYGPIKPRTKIVSVCGLPQCVNPKHWAFVAKPSEYRLAFHKNQWSLVMSKTNQSITTSRVVSVRGLDGVVHAIRATPDGGLTVLCDTALDLSTSFVLDAPITCKAGC